MRLYEVFSNKDYIKVAEDLGHKLTHVVKMDPADIDGNISALEDLSLASFRLRKILLELRSKNANEGMKDNKIHISPALFEHLLATKRLNRQYEGKVYAPDPNAYIYSCDITKPIKAPPYEQQFFFRPGLYKAEKQSSGLVRVSRVEQEIELSLFECSKCKKSYAGFTRDQLRAEKGWMFVRTPTRELAFCKTCDMDDLMEDFCG